MPNVTKEEFHAYVRVQREGQFNMFDPSARLLTGLPKETYFEIMKKYRELHDRYGEPEVGRQIDAKV